MQNLVRFDSLRVGAEFRLPFSTLQHTKKSATSAMAYNDFDEFVGIDHFRPSDRVEQVAA